MKKKPDYYVEEGKKWCHSGYRTANFSNSVYKESALRQANFVLLLPASHLRSPGEGAVDSQPAHQMVSLLWAGWVAEAQRACGPQASLRLLQSSVRDALGPLPAVSHFPPPPHKHAGVQGKERAQTPCTSQQHLKLICSVGSFHRRQMTGKNKDLHV